MAKELKDYTAYKNEHAVMAQARKDAMDYIGEKLKSDWEIFGQFQKTSYGFIMGEALNESGAPCDVAVEVRIVVKQFKDHKGIGGRDAFDLQQAIYDFENNIEE